MNLYPVASRSRNVFFLCMVAVLLLAAGAYDGLAQERPGSATLELTLELGTSALNLGEPVYATVRLVNAGMKPVEVVKLLDPQTGAIQIEVSSANRPRFVFLPLFYSDAVHARTALAPGQAVVAVFPIFYGALGWTFDRPGTYRVTAEYRPQSGTQRDRIRSRAASVTVADEHGAGASLLTGSSAGEEAAKFLLWQRGDQLQAGQALLTGLLTQQPDSPLADYALLAFGRNLSRSFRNYAVGKIREADCETALSYFQRVRSERLPVFLQIQQRLDEARCLIKLSRPDEARASMERAEGLRADRTELALFFQQAIRLEPALGDRAEIHTPPW
ncbi:MAG: hypothetical protein H8K06_11765 [Nitrospira sp.]|nr:hypothetical protein [Nitrospira sp.]